MGSRSFQITRYALATSGVQLASDGDYIACYGGSDELLLVRFLSGLLPPNYSNPALTLGIINVPVAQLSWFVDLLRNEKPVHAQVDSVAARNNIATGEEPTGDFESTILFTAGNIGDVKVSQWLAKRPVIAKALVWESATGSAAYSKWTAQQKKDLQQAVAETLAGSLAALVDPPPNLAQPADDAAPLTVISVEHAWKLYLATVAHSLAIDLTGLLPWKLADLQPEQAAALLDSRHYFRWDQANGGYRCDDENGWVLPPDPATARRFLAQNFLLGTTHFDTIARVLEWCRFKFAHFLGAFDAANVQAHWHYRGYPPASRMMSGTAVVPPPYGANAFQHWTAGCWGTTGFLKCLLRVVNVPVLLHRVCGHALPGFPSEGRYLSHGDDPYNYNSVAYSFPTEDLLLDEATFQAWFGANVAEEIRCENVGRRPGELKESHSGSGPMANSDFKVEAYSVLLAGNFFDTGADAVIACKGIGGRALLIVFHPGGQTIPGNYTSAKLESGRLHVPSDTFPWYIDILRNEKPVRARLDSSPTGNALFTGDEPVGESEQGKTIWEEIISVFEVS